MPNPTRVTRNVCSALGQMPGQNSTSVKTASLGFGRIKEGMWKTRQIASQAAKKASTEMTGVIS